MGRSLDFNRNSERHVGYGRVGAEVADLLHAWGVRFTEDAPTRLICSNITGIDGWWSHQLKVLWTMWETDALPQAYRGVFDGIDTLLVPSKFNVEIFSEVHPDVRLMPLGIDVRRWQPKLRPTEGPFTVLAGGRGWVRKGIDLAITTFLNALEGEDAELWLRIEGRVENDPRLAHPQIKLIPRVPDEVVLFEAAHVFLALGRGEGYGLMPAQAIRQGLPTILTDGHGHKEFSHLAWTVGARKVPAIFGGLGDPGHWWEADVDEATDVLIGMYHDYDQANNEALRQARYAEDELAWDIPLLLEHLDLQEPVERGVWQPHGEPMCHEIRVLRRVRAEIGPHQVTMEPGETYFHTWNVKDVLHKNGALDPALWSDEYREVVIR